MDARTNPPEWLKWDDDTIKAHNQSKRQYRYIYGVKDIQVVYKEFQETSVYVSKPFTVDGNIVEVNIEADEYNPASNQFNPCISNPSSKDCTIIDTCSKDLYFCKFAKLQLADGTDISCKRYSFTNRNCTHGGGSCPGKSALERRRFGGSTQ
jgi:hypothetical protein